MLPFGELALPGRPEDERQVREAWRRPTEGLVDQELFEGVREVILAADDVRHLHQVIVDHDREVVDRNPARADQDDILDVLRMNRHRAPDQVIDLVAAILRHAQAPGGCLSGSDPSLDILRLEIAAQPVVAVVLLRRLLMRSQLRQPIATTEAGIDRALFDQALPPLDVDFLPLALRVGSERSALFRSFVGRQSQPLQAREDRAPSRIGVAFLVGVLHPQDEDPAGLAREQPVEQRRAGAADVQITRR